MSPDRIFFFSSFNHKHIFLVKCIPEIGIVLQVKAKKKRRNPPPKFDSTENNFENLNNLFGSNHAPVN